VQGVLRAHFEGRPINEQNLSDWRMGGYEEWLQYSETREWVTEWIGEAEDLEFRAGDNRSLADFLAAPLAVEMAKALRRISVSTEMSEKERLEGILAIARASTQVRRANQLGLQQCWDFERQELADRDEIEAQVKEAEEGAERLKTVHDLVLQMRAEEAKKKAERKAKREQREAAAAEKARAEATGAGVGVEVVAAKSSEESETPGEGTPVEAPTESAAGKMGSDPGPRSVRGNQGESRLIKVDQPGEPLDRAENPVAESPAAPGQQNCAGQTVSQAELWSEASQEWPVETSSSTDIQPIFWKSPGGRWIPGTVPPQANQGESR
jgi:hypothetical protein